MVSLFGKFNPLGFIKSVTSPSEGSMTTYRYLSSGQFSDEISTFRIALSAAQGNSRLHDVDEVALNLKLRIDSYLTKLNSNHKWNEMAYANKALELAVLKRTQTDIASKGMRSSPKVKSSLLSIISKITGKIPGAYHKK